MSHFDKVIRNNRGVTLIELLIALVISTIILGVVYGVMITGYKTYQKIAVEGAIRDEGDFVISRIMQLFYDTDISDIRKCDLTADESKPNFCIEIHNTEISKITSADDNKKVSITSLDELKIDESVVTQIKINTDNNIIIENYGTKKNKVDKKIEIDLSNPIGDPEIINSKEFEFVKTDDLKTSSNLVATCSYSSVIVADPEKPEEKYIKKKCNNGIANITLIIKKSSNDDQNFQFKLNSKFGF